MFPKTQTGHQHVAKPVLHPKHTAEPEQAICLILCFMTNAVKAFEKSQKSF